MDAIETVRGTAAAVGKPITHIGIELGRRPNYVNGVMSRGSTPQADTLAAMLGVCGYALAAVPVDDLPASALAVQLDAAERQDRARLIKAVLE